MFRKFPSIVGATILLRHAHATEGLAFHNLAPYSPEELIYHGYIADNDGNKGLAHSPGTSLLRAADRVAKNKHTTKNATRHDEDASAEHTAEENFALDREVGSPKHLRDELMTQTKVWYIAWMPGLTGSGIDMR